MGELKLWYAKPRRGGRSLAVAVALTVLAYAAVLLALVFIEYVLLELLRGVLGTGIDRSNGIGALLIGAAWVGVGWKIFRLMRELVSGLASCHRETPAEESVTVPPDEST